MTPLQIKQYLERIEYANPLRPDLQTIKQLQRQHLLNIPFENLDIHKGIPIYLNTKRIFEKIVLHNRGGFCYELNGLFCELLEAIGFDVKKISGRVYDKEKGYGKEYDHLALIVTIKETEYLVDVGFGEFAFSPLPFRLDRIYEDERGTYLFDKYDAEYFRVNKKSDGILKPSYIFKNKKRAYEEFSGMCHYHQTNSDSHFLQKRFIGMATERGRVSINGNILKIQNGGVVQERTFEEAELEELLGRYFKFG